MKKQMETILEEKEYPTPDMGLATCLMVEGIKYIRADKDPEWPTRKRLFFIFEVHPEIDRVVRERANGSHVVSSTSYEDAQRRIKTIIHS